MTTWQSVKGHLEDLSHTQQNDDEDRSHVRQVKQWLKMTFHRLLVVKNLLLEHPTKLQTILSLQLNIEQGTTGVQLRAYGQGCASQTPFTILEIISPFSIPNTTIGTHKMVCISLRFSRDSLNPVMGFYLDTSVIGLMYIASGRVVWRGAWHYLFNLPLFANCGFTEQRQVSFAILFLEWMVGIYHINPMF